MAVNTSLPWGMKLCNVIVALAAQSVHSQSPNVRDRLLIVYALVCLGTLGLLMPSMIFSVRNRTETTSFCTRLLTALVGIGIVMCCMWSEATTRPHTAFAMQMLLCHTFYCQCSEMRHRPKVLLYHKTAMYCFAVTAVVSPLALATCTRSLQPDVFMLFALFVAEINSFITGIISSIILITGDAYERALDTD